MVLFFFVHLELKRPMDDSISSFGSEITSPAHCLNMRLMRLTILRVNRQHVDTRQVFEEKAESCSDSSNAPPLTKHVNPSDENVDKACLSVSRAIPVAGENVVHAAVIQDNARLIGDDSGWSDIQATEARIAYVREIATETEGRSLDISVVSQPTVNSRHDQEPDSFHQP